MENNAKSVKLRVDSLLVLVALVVVILGILLRALLQRSMHLLMRKSEPCDQSCIILLRMQTRNADLPGYKTGTSVAKAADFQQGSVETYLSLFELKKIFADSTRLVVPYTVEASRVICTELDWRDLKSTDDDCTFYYQKQRAYSTMVYSVPMNDFVEACSILPENSDKVVFLHSTGRCGSTLLSRIIGCTEAFVTISEPDFFSAMTLYVQTGAMDKHVSVPLYAAATRLLVHKELSASPQYKVLIKLRSFAITQAAAIVHNLPGSKNIYMYRNAMDTIDSYAIAFAPMLEGHMAKLFKFLGIFNFVVWYIFPRVHTAAVWGRVLFPIMHDPSFAFPQQELYRLNIKGHLALGWLGNVHCANDLRTSGQRGFWSAIVRYDEIKDCVETNMTTFVADLLHRCGLEEATVNASDLISILQMDAHKGCTRSKRRELQSKALLALSDQDVTMIEKLLAAHPTIQHGKYMVPGTMLI